MFGVRNDSTYSTNDVNKTMSIATWYEPDTTGQTFLSSNGGDAKKKVSSVNLVTKKKINNVWHYFDMGYLHDFLAGTQVCGVTYYTYAAAKGRNNSNTILEPTSTNEDGYYDCGNYNLYSENWNFTNRIVHFEYYSLPESFVSPQWYQKTTSNNTNNIYKEYLGMMEKFDVISNSHIWRHPGRTESVSDASGWPWDRNTVYVQGMKPVMVNLDKLVLYSYAIYDITGQLAHLYSGYPMCKITADGDFSGTIKIDVSTNILVAKEQFSNETFEDEKARLETNGKLVASGNNTKELKLSSKKVKKNDILWVKIFSAGNISTEDLILKTTD